MVNKAGIAIKQNLAHHQQAQVVRKAQTVRRVSYVRTAAIIPVQRHARVQQRIQIHAAADTKNKQVIVRMAQPEGLIIMIAIQSAMNAQAAHRFLVRR